MAALRSAIRKGMLAGERRVDDLLRNGAGSLMQPEEHASYPKLQEVIDVYIASKDRPSTIAEIREVGSALVALVGNVSVADVKSSHIRNFLKGQAARQVGGKDPHSVARPLSPATLQKKLALIRAAFAYSIERDELQVANPASGINVTAFAQTVSAAAMPDKRPFSLGELQKVFAHPWFTGCASVRDIYAPGSHRLDGMHYWVLVVAALTGMRAHHTPTGLLGKCALDIDVGAAAARGRSLELDMAHRAADLDDDIVPIRIVFWAKDFERLLHVEQEVPCEFGKEDVLDHLFAQHRMLRGPQIEHGATLPR
ncbi:MAG: hypothetical protein ACRDRQ_27380 [Pseudonocardiaceae bacterium]